MVLKKRLLFIFFLLMLQISLSVQAQSAIYQDIKKAQLCFTQLDESSNFQDNLNHIDISHLPIGTRTTIGNMDVAIAVNSAEFFPDYTSVGIFVRVKIPESKKSLFFGAKDVKLSHDGDIIGHTKAVLLGDVEIPFTGNSLTFRLKGNYDDNDGQSDDLTFVEIDCKGFKNMQLVADVEIFESLCCPVDNSGNVLAGGKVSARFQTQVSSWGDILAKVSLPPFIINGLDGFIWNVEEASFDFSDTRNSPSFSIPKGYNQYLITGNESLWRGIHVRKLSVTLPEYFARKSNQPVNFEANDLLIDDNGISGVFCAETTILPLTEGNANGWSFSVDYFGLTLMANTLEEATFKGLLVLPTSQDSYLRYNGIIGANNKCALQVEPLDTLSIDFLQAKAEIDPNSYVLFTLENKKFKPEAMLHGRMGIRIADETGNKTLTEFKGVEFRSLHLKTENPYLQVEYFGYQDEVKLMNFPLSVSNISLTTDASGLEATIGFDVQMNLGDVFAGGTRLSIVGKMDNGDLQRWQYKRMDIAQIEVNATIADIFKIEGNLNVLNNDPIYGDGFGGDMKITFNKVLNGLNVNARGMFGCSTFKYWFIDGIATIPGVGIPVYPSFFLNGFGGGLTYKMKPVGIDYTNGDVLSSTSMVYVPDESMSLGIKASTAFFVAERNVVQGEASFDLAFNKNGGLSYAGFYGYAKFAGNIPGMDDFQKNMSAKYAEIIEKEQSFGNKDKLISLKQYQPNEVSKALGYENKVKGKDGFMANLGMQFNFSESSFHSTFELYVNVLGGVILGVGNENKAGYAVMHIDPQQWYLHMGTPTDRIGLRMGIGNILNIETGSYLMVGTNIPAAPGIPPQVASILGYQPSNIDYMNSLNSLDQGKGFAFGSSFRVNTGDLTFLILYANYDLGMGFDVMLKDYLDAQCKGRSGAIGMDGWYANGQAYAYMHGELGVKVNLWFMKARLPIISADVAALMQAMLPNPTSFKTYLTARANLLGGLVKVNCRFKISVGEECELVLPGGSPLNMAMISDLSPTDKSTEVSVFTAPQASFNMAVGKAFDVQDDSGERTFRIQLKDFVLSDGSNVIGELKWNPSKDAVSFYSHEVLPPRRNITATIRVVFEELRNGVWNPVYTEGKEAVESKTISFVTADAPKDIPLQNIEYCYPVVGQKYYLHSESTQGYVQLRFGQTYLFPEDMKNQIIYEDSNGKKQNIDFRYDSSNKWIAYTVPNVNNTTAYKISVVSLNKNEQINTVQTVKTQSLLNDSEEGNIDITNKQAVAEIRTDVGKVLLWYSFSTSAYNTFRNKINNIQKTVPVYMIITSDVAMFKYETKDMEPFDLAELTGVEQTANKPLIDVRATLDEDYYNKKIYPLIYHAYPLLDRFTVSRDDAQEIGVPPAKALPVVGAYLDKIMYDDYTGLVKTIFPYYYNLPQYYKNDFVDLQGQIINNYAGTTNDIYRRFLMGQFPRIDSGNYRINLQYVMPDGTNGSNAIFDYYNFIR